MRYKSSYEVGPVTWYRMPEGGGSAIEVTPDEASLWNTPEKGFGIFLSVNAFSGARRKENLTRVCAWAIDIDEGTKTEQAKRVMASPVVPSLVVETKRGFQVWWAAQQGAKPEHWNAIVLERLVPRFGADKNARDLCRILRVPGFLHLKDPSDPFRVREVWRHHVAYSERQMAEAFEWTPSRETQQRAHERAQAECSSAGVVQGQGFWDAVYNLDCEEGLRRLSGRPEVGGEVYTFRRASRGHQNVIVNKKGSSCFLDASKRIGSLSGGGPTLYNWLSWYGNQPRECVRILKDIFPELVEIS